MVLGGDDDVLHAGVLGGEHDGVGIEVDGVELRGEGVVGFERDLGGGADPLAVGVDAVPLSGGDGVETPVDEEAEAGVAPPLHARVLAERGVVEARGGSGHVRLFRSAGGEESEGGAGEEGQDVTGQGVTGHGGLREGWSDQCTGIVTDAAISSRRDRAALLRLGQLVDDPLNGSEVDGAGGRLSGDGFDHRDACGIEQRVFARADEAQDFEG